MLKDILIGQYYPGNSFIHRLDPRTKIVAIAVYVVVLLLVQTGAGYAAAAVFTLLTAALARIPLNMLIRSLRPVVLLLVLTVVLHAFMSGREGAPLLVILGLRLTDVGLVLGLKMGLRLTLLIVTSSLLTLTTSPIELTDGIERLLRPAERLRLPVHELAMMMTIALRFIPTLMEEADRIIKAQTARGADFQSGRLSARLRSLIPILVPLFISAFRRADDLAMAMEARCYRGGKGRVRYKQLRFSARDVVAGAVASLAAVLIIWLGR